MTPLKFLKGLAMGLSLSPIAGISYASAQSQVMTSVERWGKYETTFLVPAAEVTGNPFEVELVATFVCDRDTLIVPGYYDGPEVVAAKRPSRKGKRKETASEMLRWKVRFMPPTIGEWQYTTASPIPSLNGQSGYLRSSMPQPDNHGPVRVDSTGLHFCYADGLPYLPVGTTSYDWMHASNDPAFSTADPGLTMQQQTLVSLGESGFNKIRSLLIVQNFDRSYPEPESFPFEGDTSRWDWSRLNPRYFDHVEQCIEGLQALGLEMDLILFHPYDGGRWGFDSMPREAGELLCRYVAARFGAYRNVWWSLANEYDFLKEQPIANWDAWTDVLLANDPYHHLISIHSYTAKYYKYWDERYTHCSIQDQAPVEDFGRAATVRNIYKKPVIFDEVCYEGDMGERWGWLSGQEMLFRMYQAYLAGTYCTHAECFQYGNPHDFSRDFLAVGGKWQGESWMRINFMRHQILDEMPRPMYLPDSSWDPYTSACGPGYYMVYLGKTIGEEWRFDLPIRNLRDFYPRIQEGEHYQVEIIDTWNMTIERCPITFETKKQDFYRMVDSEARSVKLPQQPYLLLRIKRID